MINLAINVVLTQIYRESHDSVVFNLMYHLEYKSTHLQDSNKISKEKPHCTRFVYKTKLNIHIFDKSISK